MSEITKPLENTKLSEFYLNELFKEIRETKKDYFNPFARNRKKYSKEALLEQRLMEKKEGKISIPVSEITYQFAELTGTENPEKQLPLEMIYKMNMRIVALILDEDLTPQKLIQMSEKLFENSRLKNIIKTIYILARDYTIDITNIRKDLQNAKNEFIEIEEKEIEKQKEKIAKAKIKKVRDDALKKIKEKEKDLKKLKTLSGVS